MYKKILIPVEGREGAWRAIRSTTQAVPLLAEDGEILLLPVEEPRSQLVSGDDRKQLKEADETHGKSRLQPVKDFLDSKKVKYSLLVRNGVIADTIVRTAHEENADLIVMFTDGVQNLSELVFGSITQRVLKNIDIDLLSVRK